MASSPQQNSSREPISSETVDTLLDSLESINKKSGGASTSSGKETTRPKPGTAAYRRLMAWERLREQTLNKVRDTRDQQTAADCTFQPNVPHAKHRSDEPEAPIVQRLEERAKRHDEALLQMQREKEKKEAEECTFKPTLSVGSERYHRSNSRQSTPRGGESDNTESYHQNHDQEDRGYDDSSNQPQFAYHSHNTPRTVQEQRAHTESSKARHRDPVEDYDAAECTFQPKIGPKSKLIYQTARIEEGSTDVFNRLYQRSTPGRASASRRTRSTSADGRSGGRGHNSSFGQQQHHLQLPPVMLEEMKTLRTRFGYQHEPNDGMRCFLQNILQDEEGEGGRGGGVPQPIITAYSDEHCYIPPTEEEQQHASAENVVANTPANTLSGVSPVSHGGPHHLSSSNHHQNSTTSAAPGGENEEVMDFQEFLVRQDLMHDKRKEHHRKLLDQYTPSHKPSLCDESIRLAAASGWESLSSKKRRDLESSRKKDLTNPDQQSRNLSFQPKVSQPAELLPSRTPEEMWNDGERRQKRIDELREQSQKKKMAGSTFKPETNKNYPEVKSMLSGNDLTSYTEHLANKRRKEQEKANQEKERKIRLEEEACTFKPKTNVTPSYIARMAQGISILRESSHIN